MGADLSGVSAGLRLIYTVEVVVVLVAMIYAWSRSLST